MCKEMCSDNSGVLISHVFLTRVVSPLLDSIFQALACHVVISRVSAKGEGGCRPGGVLGAAAHIGHLSSRTVA